MTPEKRQYQIDAENNILNAFRQGIKSVLLTMPTGGGKTFVFSKITKKAESKGTKTAIFTHRGELLKQAGGSLYSLGVDAGYVNAGVKKYDKTKLVHVVMAQTFRGKTDVPYWIEFLKDKDLIIIDECHRQEFNYLFKLGLLDDKHIIGFTATPKRGGKMRQLALDYEKLIDTVSVKWLIENEFLVNDDTYDIGGVDLDGVSINASDGDYNESSMFAKFNTPQLYAGAVENWQEHAKDTKTIVFCVNKEHTMRTCAEFYNAGISAKFVISSTPKPKYPENETLPNMEKYAKNWHTYLMYNSLVDTMSGTREQVFTGHQNGEFKVLFNAGIATTGYDDKSLQTGIILRATLSEALYLQMIGRLSRTFPGKDFFTLLDFGGNRVRFGEYAADRSWSLWHEKKEGKGLPPIKSCGFDGDGFAIKNGGVQLIGCNRPIMASMKICPFCGFVYPAKEIKKVVLKLTSQGKSTKEMNHAELKNYHEFKGHKQPWLWFTLWSRGGEDEIRAFARSYRWKPATTEKAINFMQKKTTK